MATPVGRLARGEIITQALNRAGNPKIKIGARIALNRILEALYTEHEWPDLATTLDGVSLSGPSFPLPADFLRVVDDLGLQILTVSGAPYKIAVKELDPQAFEAVSNPVDQVSTHPFYYRIDRAANVGRLWPRATTAVTGRLRYVALPADVEVSGDMSDPTYDADVPRFFHHGHLIEEVYAWALAYDKDHRATEAKMLAKESLAMVRGRILPRKAIPTTLELDPDVFSTPYRRS